MPAGFRFPMVADLWLPLSAMPGYGEDRNARVIDVVGRLGPGRTPTQAVAELEPIALRLAQDLPEPGRATAVTVAPFTGDIRPMYPFLIALMASVGLVLLIACVNVANLLCSRARSLVRGKPPSGWRTGPRGGASCASCSSRARCSRRWPARWPSCSPCSRRVC